MKTPSTTTILVADDEESIRFVLKEALSADGHEVVCVAEGRAALQKITAGPVDVALVDIKMPDLDGLELLTQARTSTVAIPIIIMTAQNTMANAIEAMKRGAFDYVTKPFDIEEIRALVHRALEMRRMSSDLARLGNEMRRRFELGVEIIGKTPAMLDIYKTIGRVAPTDATVLVQGESGTGKELIAKAVHYHSSRWSGPFIALNCSAIPRELLESELFGYERGAFTGALEQRPGKFEIASGGTLFLDEVGDMPLELQAKLLRVLQEKELTRVGGREVVKVDCRIIAATNQDLERAIAQGRFREDLYFRLKVVPIIVPPLRERRDDIPELIAFFVEKVNRELGTSVTGVSPEARAILAQHNWPGNVRELENTLVRAAVLAPGPTLMPRDLALAAGTEHAVPHDHLSLEEVVRLKLTEYFRQTRTVELADLYPLILGRVEKPLIELVLERANGNQLKAATMLGINRNTLRKKITDLKIDLKRRGSTD
jgi:two-component system nitrogen regulation response regulator GlnG